MIKTEKGLLEIKGDLHETLADYKVITVELRKMLEETIGKERAEEEMQEAMQLSRMSEDEIGKYLEKKMERKIERKAEQIVEGIRKIMADRK